MSGLKVVWGAYPVAKDRQFNSKEIFDQLAKVLKDGGCTTLDTATLYQGSQESLAEYGAQHQFTIDTKAMGGFVPDHSKKEGVIADGEGSQKLLGNVDVWYLHAPDTSIPLEDTLQGINEMHKRGFFKRFGLSNFKADRVEEAYKICKDKGYPLPQVYQGNYNAVARLQETELFPTLRKLGMSFYAYSPIAGGFLTKSKQDIKDGKGRFDTESMLGKMYNNLYGKDTILDALDEWDSIAKSENIPRAELAYRWISYHSPLDNEHGDALVIGSSSVEQARQTLEGLKHGPLKDDSVKRIDAIWEKIKHDAPLDNYHSYSHQS